MSAESEEEELGYSNIAYTKIYLKHITKTQKPDSFMMMLRKETPSFIARKERIFKEHDETSAKVEEAKAFLQKDIDKIHAKIDRNEHAKEQINEFLGPG